MNNSIQRSLRRVSRRSRRGSAIVEVAICLPTIVVLLLGAVEGNRAFTLQHTLHEVAHTTCRLYAVQDRPAQDAIDLADQALTAAGITAYTLTFDPSTKSGIDKQMKPVTVTLTVDFATVAWLPPGFLAGATLTGTCTMPADLGEEAGDSSGSYDPLADDYEGDGYVRHDDEDDDDDD